MMNFTVQDIFGTLVGFILFPLVLIVPGYLVGHFLHILDFRLRRFASRLALSLLLSIGISPILYYLIASLLSLKMAVMFTHIFFLIFILILFLEKSNLSLSFFYIPKAILWVVLCWGFLGLFSLVDLQWNANELYFSVESYDHTTRVSIIDAMTRTGVPPVNPSYYPGQYVKLTFLYFFWYILGSVIDFIGGNFVTARTALFASIIWCGIALMVCISFYLLQRDEYAQGKIWKRSLIGVLLLSVTGLDVLPTIALMRVGNGSIGDLEHWNEQITAWIGSLLWAPHHVAGLITGILAIMLAQSARTKRSSQQYILFALSGVAFASMVGLSIWVALVFIVFWGIWMLSIFVQEKGRSILFLMFFSGFVALILAGTFLFGLLSSSGVEPTEGSFPIAVSVRHFRFVDILLEDSSLFIQSLMRLIFLPVNYLFELGFFMAIGLLWWKLHRLILDTNRFYKVELILFLASFFFGTFTRSTLIMNNDLGWRAWLPGQFILLIWSVDILYKLYNQPFFVISVKTKAILLVLALLGISTTILDISLLRFAYYFAFGPEVGQRIYSARQTYTFINNSLPQDVIVQYNPSNSINRPSGLYGMRQSAISDRTAYGIPTEIYLSKVSAVSQIFNFENLLDWHTIDKLCQNHFIDVLVISDYDKLWGELPLLSEERIPLYKDNHYVVFACGAYAE